MSEKPLPKDRDCIIICDQGYGDKKIEYVNAFIVSVAKKSARHCGCKKCSHLYCTSRFWKI